MAKEPIVSTLFRFVTLRNPKLLSKKERERGFIYYPKQQKSDSHFLVDLDDEEDRDTRRGLLDSRLAAYAPMNKRSQVENVKPTLYEFSDWLMKNKNIFTTEDISSKSSGVDQLTNQELIRLWDNLHYQVLTKKSVAVREATIRMIIADNFLKNNDFQTTKDLVSDEKEMRRLANAYVVIDNYILNSYRLRNQEARTASPKDLDRLSQELAYFELTEEIEVYESALKDIESNIEKVNELNKANYEKAYSQYEEDVEQAFRDATPASDTKDEEIYNNLNLPELNYTPKSIYDTDYLENNFEEKTLAVIKNQNGTGSENEELLLKNVTALLRDKYNALSENTEGPKVARYRGNIIKSNQNEMPLYSFSVGIKRNITDSDQADLNLILVSGSQDTRITNTDIDVTFSGGSSLSNLSVSVKKRADKNIVISTSETFKIPQNATFLDLNGEVTLSTGEVIEIAAPEIALDGRKSEGTGSNKLAAEKPRLTQYGIDKIGVADFTRVEQEVCCYVSGEVSRIENILAKEYKERGTRQLLSTETTTEETTEKEVEELTDTTTSERSELSTEVSSILNEDKSKNYGASAGVSGEAFGVEFYANGYLDGASSSSSSNSNNTSQTYAEEVTRRALERVVQKTTKKRTSRILREFEENNKHGFDNRGGTEHVTGIYRWVDKIYTNRLVNYGKRLMYEFSVPEPSRFFKSAIIQQLESEEQQNTSPDGLIIPEKPKIPQHYGIFSATIINEYNYQLFASRYGAEVSPPIDRYIKVGESFAKDDKTFDTNGYAFENIKIPENYLGYSGIVKTQWGKKANADWYLSVSLGDIRQSKNESGGHIYSTFNFSNNYRDEVPFSIYSRNVFAGHFNVTILCERSPEAYRKWQDETYKAIIAAYQEKINAYNDYLNASFVPNPLDPGETTVEFNPAVNRDLEKRELKRLAIEMMARPFGITTARNNYGGSVSHIWLTQAFQEHSEYVKFFEQAFEWEIMAYIFYPYFYAEERNDGWKDLFQQRNDSDPLFQAFLQSGMARMVVPVRPGFEKAVNYFLETGDIMIGDQLAVDRDDDLYLSIAEEMEQPAEGKVEKEWETRVPTALTIVQSNSAPLDETGLPCCHNEDETENLAHGTSVMISEGDTA